jgi:hypothetical protein
MKDYKSWLESEIQKADKELSLVPDKEYPKLYNAMGRLRELKACLRNYITFTQL